VQLPDSIERRAPELWWDAGLPLYEAGRYAEAAAKGRELIAAHPGQAYVVFNTACCESLAGEPAAAIEHLRQAIELWDGCRELARNDSDFELVRGEAAFRALVDD
jgi:tetratricopeptide (TPR) repeat protein